MRASLAFPAAVVAATLFACDEDVVRQQDFVLPSQVRSTYPADGAANVGHGQLGVSVTFREDADPTEVELSVFPPIQVVGNPERSGRTLTWPLLDLEAGPDAYVFVLDGPFMRRPHLFRCFPGPELETHGRFAGKISVVGLNRDPQEAVVFAILAEQVELDAANMIQVARSRPDMVAAPTPPVNGESWYLMEYLEIDRDYAVVAILDTSGDGIYDPLDDAWGYYRHPKLDRGGVATGKGFENVQGRPTPAWTTDNDIIIEPLVASQGPSSIRQN